jgi:hypothetical protein
LQRLTAHSAQLVVLTLERLNVSDLLGLAEEGGVGVSASSCNVPHVDKWMLRRPRNSLTTHFILVGVTFRKITSQWQKYSIYFSCVDTLGLGMTQKLPAHAPYFWLSDCLEING